MVKLYKKKPVTVEAILFDGRNALSVLEFIGLKNDVDYDNPFQRDGYDLYERKLNKEGIHIDTLEGKIHASPGDYIIKGVKGEFYPCKPNIFKMTYEEA